MASGINSGSTIGNSLMLREFGTGGAEKASEAKPGTGSGSIGASGQAPDVQRSAMMGAVMSSLAAMMPKLSGQAVDVLLLQVTTAMKDTISKSEKGKIESDTNVKKTQIDEKKAKMDEANKKIEEAENKMKNMSIWDKIKVAFQYIGAIMAIIAGALAIAAGVALGGFTGGLTAIAGVVGGIAMISAGVMMLGMAADATVGLTNKDGLGIVGLIAKDYNMKHKGMSEEDALADARSREQISRIVVAVIASVLAIGGAIASGPAVAAAAGSTAMAIAGNAVNVVNGVTTAASATGDMTVGILKREAQEQKAEGTKRQAEGKEMQAMIQQLDDMIDMAMQRLKGAGDRFEAMLDSLTDAIKDRGDTMSRVGLRA